MEEKIYRFWLHQLPGVGDRTIERLLAAFGSAERVCHAGEELKKVLKEKAVQRIVDFNKTFEPQRAWEQMLAQKISFYTIQDQEYPHRLRRLCHPPYGIYCLGRLPRERRPAAAIIGARECSGYGSYVAKAFAGGLADAGVSIISGMARGIDGLSQQAALEHRGLTWAVLGCGVDICYPASNRKLYEEILEKGGGILSVFPPATPPARGQFPERNRIVAGLSDLVLVVEARQKSGTLITVDMALEQGKHVYAVPGRLTDRLSDGCNLLIRQGAGIALSPADLLVELKLLGYRRTLGDCPEGGGKEGIVEDTSQEEGAAEEKELLEERKGGARQKKILGLLDCHPRSADEILEAAREAGLSLELPELLAELIELCTEGRVRQQGAGRFSRTDMTDLFAEEDRIGYNENQNRGSRL